MIQLKLIVPFLVLATASISRAQDNTYILSWINRFLSSQGVYPFDPNPTQAAAMIIPLNNLQPTTLADDKYYVLFAFASYCEDSLQTWSCTYCNEIGQNVRFDYRVSKPIPNTMAYFAVDDTRKEIILTFRGSINVPNAAYDFDRELVPPTPTDTSGILVHKGFRDSTMTLYPDVVTHLTNLTTTYPTYKVKIVGQSLGGSQATMTMFLFRYTGLFINTEFSVFTYGEPRVGNLAFATYYNALNIASARVVHRADFAPHIVAQYNQSYVHHGNEVWNVNSTYTKEDCSTVIFEDPNCSNSQGPIYSFIDHIYYFDIDVVQCGFDDPIETILQFIVNLNALIPPVLRSDLILNWIRIPLKYQIILQPLLILLGK